MHAGGVPLHGTEIIPFEPDTVSTGAGKRPRYGTPTLAITPPSHFLNPTFFTPFGAGHSLFAMLSSRPIEAIRRATLAVIAVLTFGTAAEAQPIYDAIARGDVAAVKRLIAEDRTVVRQISSNSPLRAALAAEQLEIAGILLDNGASPYDSHIGMPIYFTALWQRTDHLRLLLEHGFDAGTQHNGYPLLQFAVGFDSLSTVRLLLEHGANANDTNRFGRTALYLCRSAAMVDLLVAHGATVGFATRRKITPLHYVTLNDTGAVAALLRHGANIEAQDSDGDTPLAWTALYWRPACAAALLRVGARRDPHGWGGQTPLIEAVARYAHNLRDSIRKRTGYDEIATATTVDASPHGPYGLDYSLDYPPDTNDVLATIDVLLGGGVDVDAVDANGFTALHHAARAGLTTVAERLIRNRANVNIRDRRGRTPMAAARAARSKAMIRMLAAAGAK